MFGFIILAGEAYFVVRQGKVKRGNKSTGKLRGKGGKYKNRLSPNRSGDCFGLVNGRRAAPSDSQPPPQGLGATEDPPHVSYTRCYKNLEEKEKQKGKKT